MAPMVGALWRAGRSQYASPRMTNRIVIVGAGQAAAQAVETLRRNGHAGSITLIGDEPTLPYQRPPLSKKFLAGTLDRDRLLIRHGAFYAEHGVTLFIGHRAAKLHRESREIEIADGRRIPYDGLLIATGAQPRRLSVPGSGLRGIHTLRSTADVDAIRGEVARGRRAVIVGGGYIGLEVAATLKEAGLAVTVIEAADRVMNRVACEAVSRFYEAEHARHGVRIELRMGLEGYVGEDRVRAVRCPGGIEVPADLVIVGVGVQPCQDLAAEAGLDCANGIVVDEYCRTGDPHIFAAGDCTEHPSARYGRRLRLESVDNAFEQATTAALNLLGKGIVHDKTPWFWSDQYDLKLIIVGLSQGHDQVVLRGDPSARSFSVCYLRAGELIAIDTVNSTKDQMAARKLVPARVRPDPARLADPGVPLKDCVAPTA